MGIGVNGKCLCPNAMSARPGISRRPEKIIQRTPSTLSCCATRERWGYPAAGDGESLWPVEGWEGAGWPSGAIGRPHWLQNFCPGVPWAPQCAQYITSNLAFLNHHTPKRAQMFQTGSALTRRRIADKKAWIHVVRSKARDHRFLVSGGRGFPSNFSKAFRTSSGSGMDLPAR